MPYCPNCGAEIEVDAQACINCGVETSAPVSGVWPPKPSETEPPRSLRTFKLVIGSAVGDFLLAHIAVLATTFLYGAGIILGVVWLVKAQEYKYLHNGAKWALLTLITLFLGLAGVCIVMFQNTHW